MRDTCSTPPFPLVSDPLTGRFAAWPKGRVASATVFLLLPSAVWAQTPSVAPATTDLGQVEIRSTRNNDTEARRESTASKIVIGREEIDKQGDATLGEVLKRLPGVTVQGAPGRGGAIRMRGLGNGYTQIAAASQHTLALKSDGTVMAWGFNGLGECDVPSGLGGVVAASCSAVFLLQTALGL